jgi:beta-lactam-binding protein with PASTA domain
MVREAGYKARIRREPSFQPDNLVFAQSPGATRPLARGKVVVLLVSEFEGREPPPAPPPPPSSPAPKVVGFDYWEAATRMEELGFVANLYPVRSRKKALNVIAQVPRPGRTLRRGDSVRLTVSTGRRPQPPATIPNTVGLLEKTAHERCRDARFTCRTIRVPTRHPRGPGRVVRQKPDAGTTAKELTQMTLFVGG